MEVRERCWKWWWTPSPQSLFSPKGIYKPLSEKRVRPKETFLGGTSAPLLLVLSLDQLSYLQVQA